MSTDKITTISGIVVGVSLLLSAFEVVTSSQAQAIGTAAPLIIAGIAVMVQGFYTNK